MWSLAWHDRAKRLTVRLSFQHTMLNLSKLTASDGAAGDVLGLSVAVAGGTFVAGAWGANVGGNAFQGAVYLFSRPT
jgi:hypothetical protein